jgi:hypothetical protein
MVNVCGSPMAEFFRNDGSTNFALCDELAFQLSISEWPLLAQSGQWNSPDPALMERAASRDRRSGM